MYKLKDGLLVIILLSLFSMPINAEIISPTKVYDDDLRLIKIDYPGEDYDTISEYDEKGRITYVINKFCTIEYEYDENENLKKENRIIGGESFTTTYEYDSRGNIASIKYLDMYETTRYQEFDEQGNIIRLVEDGIATDYNYNPQGELVAEFNDISGAKFYMYDDGKVIKITENLEQEMIYEESGTFVSTTISSKDSSLNIDYSSEAQEEGVFVYDITGRLVKVEYSDGTNEEYFYDGLDRMIAMRDIVDKEYIFLIPDNINSAIPFNFDFQLEPIAVITSTLSKPISKASINQKVNLVSSNIYGRLRFEIWEDDVLIDDFIKETTPQEGVSEWTISQEDYAKATQGGFEDQVEFYFKVYNEAGEVVESGPLEVSTIPIECEKTLKVYPDTDHDGYADSQNYVLICPEHESPDGYVAMSV